MKEVAILTFTTDGTGHGLYTDAIPLAEIGRLSVRRVSRIDYEESTQVWAVRPVHGRTVLYRHASRAECVAWETRFFAQ